jgi:Leucine-rich repeat (LRR) protein
MPDQPLPKSWRPRLRMSMRALMILVLILGGGLGWIIHQARVQRDAVAAIKKANGHIGYDWEFKDDQPSYGKTWAPEWLVKLIGIDYFGHVVAVGLYDRASDAELVQVGKLRRLSQLNLLGSHVTDAGLEHLQGITGLKALYLSKTAVGDAGLRHLRLTHVRWLSLQESAVSDAGLAQLEGLTTLEWLSLLGTRISDAGLAHLRGLTSLNELILDGTSVTDAGVKELQQTLPKLKIVR